MYTQEISAMVVDFGSTTTKYGYAGQHLPRFINPSYIGISQTRMEQQKAPKQYIFGENNLNDKKQQLKIEKLYSKGQILNFEHFQSYLNTIFMDDLKYNFYDYSLVLTQDNISNKQQRQKLTKIIFQKLNIKNLFISKKSVLSCYSTGRSTALVLDSGGDMTSTIAVHDGYAVGKTNKTCVYGGQSLNSQVYNYIDKKIKIVLPEQSSGRYTQSAIKYYKNYLARQMKENIFRNDQVNNESQFVDYKLPDNSTLKIDKHEIVDPFFTNYNNDLTFRGIHNLVAQSINCADQQIRKELYGNIISIGGNSLISYFNSKLYNKVSEVASNANYKFKLLSFPGDLQRKYSSWIGGSILGSLSSFQSFWISKQEWEEYGISIVEKKCP